MEGHFIQITTGANTNTLSQVELMLRHKIVGSGEMALWLRALDAIA